MKILVTGAKGFVGKNLCAQLKNNKQEVFEFSDMADGRLDSWCAEADFVFNLVGIDVPDDPKEMKAGNVDFSTRLLDTLKRYGNKCPVMHASSLKASLAGRFGNSEYGKSKKAGEDIFFKYAADTGVKVLVYRLPGLFGKWAKPVVNGVVGTFCNAIANDQPYKVNDPTVQLDLIYVDDLVDEMMAALQGKEHRCDYDGIGAYPVREGKYCYVPVTHRVSLGEIVSLLHKFDDQQKTLVMPEIPSGSFAKKLYSTYLSYLPASKVAFPLKMNFDGRGSVTDVMKTPGSGQFSVNVINPGATKGQYWHNSKCELFVVVSGRALIKERKIDSNQVLQFEVTGSEMKAVHMLPGYTHSIENLSDKEPLVILMWANEISDSNRPDTYSLKV